MKRYLGVFRKGTGFHEHVSGPIYRGLTTAPTTAVVLLALVLCFCVLFSASWIDPDTVIGGESTKPTQKAQAAANKVHLPKQNPLKPLLCPSENLTQTCPEQGPSPTIEVSNGVKSPSCPEFFRWIHENLRPWKDIGISKDMVERAKPGAHFRLVILNGRAYFEKFKDAFQTRDVFTLWGILQLLRVYPGRVPDLELMFDCSDQPFIRSSDYKGNDSAGPPALFGYCGDSNTLDIVFPDWSFWGWPETDISPWETLLKELKEGNERIKWIDREPYAYWKGNPFLTGSRRDLLKCNVSETQDWNARLYIQDWFRESEQGFNQSRLWNQCTHRYKIYIEGIGWSVSSKYILACNSPTLMVNPNFHDFSTRGLMPLQHYWPIRDDMKCPSIKFAVDWGNINQEKAQAMGRAASNFIQEKLKMDYVYDYMFHLLNEYAKLLKYKPAIPQNAVELCLESMACPAKASEKKFMVESMVKAPKESSPCSLPPPFSPSDLQDLLKRKADSIKQVETWEREPLGSQNHKI